jgi:hypothetical protein
MNPNNSQFTQQEPQQQPTQSPQQQFAPSSQPVNSAPLSVDPGKSMTIGAIILGFLIAAPIGLVLSILAQQKSKAAGYKNTLAVVFIIIFAFLTPFFITAVINLVANV